MLLPFFGFLIFFTFLRFFSAAQSGVDYFLLACVQKNYSAAGRGPNLSARDSSSRQKRERATENPRREWLFSDHLRHSVPRYIFSKINGLSRRLEVGPLNSTCVSVRFGPLQRYDPLGTSVSRTPGPLPRVRNGSVVLGPRWLLVGASAR